MEMLWGGMQLEGGVAGGGQLLRGRAAAFGKALCFAAEGVPLRVTKGFDDGAPFARCVVHLFFGDAVFVAFQLVKLYLAGGALLFHFFLPVCCGGWVGALRDEWMLADGGGCDGGVFCVRKSAGG